VVGTVFLLLLLFLFSFSSPGFASQGLVLAKQALRTLCFSLFLNRVLFSCLGRLNCHPPTYAPHMAR
jgi:hypothetical protein